MSGSGTPSLGDVARAAEVHPGTASRALNPQTRHLVADKTVDRVLAAAERLDYRPNAVAQGLRRQRSQTIGVLIPDLSNPMFTMIVRGIEAALAPRGFTAFIANTDNDEYTERRAFEAFRSRQVDGFIFANARRTHAQIQEAFDQKIPAVMASRSTDADLFPWVAADDDAGIGLILDHLVGLGHRRIAYMTGPQTISTGSVRTTSFVRRLRDHGLSEAECPVIQAAAYDVDSGAAGAQQFLNHFRGATALVCGNDMMAVGALRVLREAGIRVPVDISVVGFNDMALSKDLAPSLTTVAVPMWALGERAAHLLLESLAGGDPVRKTLLPVRLMERESTGPASSANAD